MVINDPESLQAAEVVQSMATEAGFDVHLAGDGVRLLACQTSCSWRLSGLY